MDSLGSYTFGASVLALAAALAYLFEAIFTALEVHYPMLTL